MGPPAPLRDKAERPKIVHPQDVIGMRREYRELRRRGPAAHAAPVRESQVRCRSPRCAQFRSRVRSSEAAAEGRSLRSRGSADLHTAHSQPSVGTPIEVPVPKNVRSSFQAPGPQAPNPRSRQFKFRYKGIAPQADSSIPIQGYNRFDQGTSLLVPKMSNKTVGFSP